MIRRPYYCASRMICYNKDMPHNQKLREFFIGVSEKCDDYEMGTIRQFLIDFYILEQASWDVDLASIIIKTDLEQYTEWELTHFHDLFNEQLDKIPVPTLSDEEKVFRLLACYEIGELKDEKIMKELLHVYAQWRASGGYRRLNYGKIHDRDAPIL